MCRYIVTSLELASDKTAIACADHKHADYVAATYSRTHHHVSCIEVTPVTLFLPSGARVAAYRPLPRALNPQLSGESRESGSAVAL